jgi:dihydroorotase
LPFEEAASGAVALETLLPAAMRLYHAGLSLPVLFAALSRNPAARLGLEGGRIAKGAPADLVVFDPDAPFVMDRATLKSKSKNTPFDGQKMQGRVLKTFVAAREVYSRG